MDNQPFKNLISFTSGSLLASVIVYLLIAAVIGGGLYFLGYKNGLNEGQSQASQEALAKINETPIGLSDQSEILRLTGEILSKSDPAAKPQFFTIKAANLNRNPLSRPTPEERKVLISANTKIIKKIRKPADQLAKERYDYTIALKKNPSAVMPISTIDSPISFNDLKAGQTARILTGSDIRNLAEFTALEINIFE